MKITWTYRIILELAVLISGLILLFQTDNYWIGELISFIGLTSFILDMTIRIIWKQQDIKTLAIVFSVFTLLNLIRHLNFYIYLPTLISFENFQFELIIFRELIWFLPSVLMVLVSVRLIINKKQINYQAYVKTKEFRYVIMFVLLAIALEMPVFGFHPDYLGGTHGHGFWDAWTHIH
jgi:hypothetical protein